VSGVPLTTRRPTIIGPRSRRWSLGLVEAVAARAVLRALVVRELKVRYAQTVLGVTWVVLQPIAFAATFSVILGRFVGVPSDGVPYFHFAWVSMIVWTCFSSAVLGASQSMVANHALITKVFVPRLLLPTAPVVAAALDGAISLGIFFTYVIVVGSIPSVLGVVGTLLAMCGVLVLAWGVGALGAITTLYFRDVRHALPFVLQLGLFMTPVVFPLSVVPDRFRLLLALNPMTGLIELFRGSVLGTAIDVPSVVVSVAVGVAIVLCSLQVFARLEPHAADRV